MPANTSSQTSNFPNCERKKFCCSVCSVLIWQPIYLSLLSNLHPVLEGDSPTCCSFRVSCWLLSLHLCFDYTFYLEELNHILSFSRPPQPARLQATSCQSQPTVSFQISVECLQSHLLLRFSRCFNFPSTCLDTLQGQEWDLNFFVSLFCLVRVLNFSEAYCSLLG
jgi:hypothetical protein